MQVYPLDYSLIVPLGFLVVAVVLTWWMKRRNPRGVKAGQATVFAIATYIIYQVIDSLISWWGDSTHQFPLLLFQIRLLLTPASIAVVAYFLYFKQVSVTDHYTEAALIGLYQVPWTWFFEIISNVYWHKTFSSVREYFFANSGMGLDLTRYLSVTISISPLLAVYMLRRSLGRESDTSAVRPFKFEAFTGHLGFGATILVALLVGFTSGIPALLKYPYGVVILPFLVLTLGYLSFSRVGLWLSGPFIYVGHILVLGIAVYLGGETSLGNFFARAFIIDLLLFGWWFAVLQMSGLSLLAYIAQVKHRASLAFVSLIVAVLYGFSLFQIEMPDIAANYHFVGFIETAVSGDTSAEPLTLTLPLPTVDGTPMTLKPCDEYEDSYTIPIEQERIVESEWGPAWEAKINRIPQDYGVVGQDVLDTDHPAGSFLRGGHFSRCPEKQPSYPDIVPLTFVRQNPIDVGQADCPFKLTSDNEDVSVNLSLILYTTGSKRQALSPFVGMRLVWSSYGYEDRIEITTVPKNEWQVAPVIPGVQNYMTTEPYIEILPFG